MDPNPKLRWGVQKKKHFFVPFLKRSGKFYERRVATAPSTTKSCDVAYQTPFACTTWSAERADVTLQTNQRRSHTNKCRKECLGVQWQT